MYAYMHFFHKEKLKTCKRTMFVFVCVFQRVSNPESPTGDRDAPKRFSRRIGYRSPLPKNAQIRWATVCVRLLSYFDYVQQLFLLLYIPKKRFRKKVFLLVFLAVFPYQIVLSRSLRTYLSDEILFLLVKLEKKRSWFGHCPN